jgi:hypothetical protein
MRSLFLFAMYHDLWFYLLININIFVDIKSFLLYVLYLLILSLLLRIKLLRLILLNLLLSILLTHLLFLLITISR